MSVKDPEYDRAFAPLPCEHVVFTDLDDLEGILVDLNTKKYYQLNETASLIWRGLERRLPLSLIAEDMVARYDVTLERATSSIETAVRHFDEQRLLGHGISAVSR
jgi:coenzyme PQQ synthesis protein D (PqqD)